MLEGARVVILAGSSGIGLEVARQAIAKGAAVTITGRSPDRLARARDSLGGAVTTAAFDALDRPAVIRFFDGIGTIDHFVSCVGDTKWGTFMTLDETLARGVLERKFWAQLFLVKCAVPHMAPGGTITLTGGTSPDRGAYSYMTAAFSAAGNHLLEALVEGLSIELSPLRINVVEPSLTDTPLWDEMSPAERADVYAQVAAQLQIKRVPTAAEVACSYIHVMESGLINGDRIRPGGGPMFAFTRKE